MEKDVIDRIKDLMEQRGLNPLSLARLAGLGDRGVRDILEGKVRSARLVTLTSIAKGLGVSLNWLATGTDESSARVPVVGFVSAGEGWTAMPDGVTEYIDFHPGAHSLIAVEIRGDSMLPVYRGGDVLVCQRQSGRAINELIGHDCVVETADGQHFVKILKKGRTPGLFTLKSYNPHFEDIENISLTWAASIAWIKRRHG